MPQASPLERNAPAVTKAPSSCWDRPTEATPRAAPRGWQLEKSLLQANSRAGSTAWGREHSILLLRAAKMVLLLQSSTYLQDGTRLKLQHKRLRTHGNDPKIPARCSALPQADLKVFLEREGTTGTKTARPDRYGVTSH